MSAEGKRIGDFTWVTPPFIIGIVATLSVLIAAGWCWSRSLADSDSLPWLVTALVTVAAIPISICCAYWAAANYVLWVEVGDELKFATLLGSQSVAWDSVRGVEFETEYKTIPLIVLPLALVVGQSCIAVVTLGSGRVLRGKIDHRDAVIIHELLSKYPRLDTHFARALSSPRDTMKTFVDAVMEDDLYYASKFLDLSKLDEQTANTLAESCARKLKDVIDSVWYIDYEEIPDDPESPSPYILASGSDQDVDEELTPVVQAIKIAHDETSGCWRFDSETVNMILREFMDTNEVGDAGQP